MKYFKDLEYMLRMVIKTFKVRMTRLQKVLVSVLLVIGFVALAKYQFSLVEAVVFGWKVTCWMAFSELIMPAIGHAYLAKAIWCDVPEV